MRKIINVLLYRLFDREYKIRKLTIKYLKTKNVLKYYKLKKMGVIISPKATIGKKLHLIHPLSIIIGEKAIIWDNCKIYQNVTIGQKNDKYPTIVIM